MRGLALVCLLSVAGCGGAYPQTTLDPTTDFGDVSQSLYVTVFIWTMIILVVVWGALGYILVRFRERPDTPHPRQVHGDLGAEVAWTIGPAIIVVAIVIPTIQGVFATQRPVRGDPMVVEVVGHRYWWEFRYLDLGIVTANELHLPVDGPVTLQMSSVDVIHSFWVPQLGGKRDVNPARRRPEGDSENYTWLYFAPRETGEFMGQCAEFCGTSHALMGVRVIVESQDDFDGWVEDMLTPSPTTQAGLAPVSPEAGAVPQADPSGADALVAQGREVFHRSTCIVCHGITGTAAVGVIGPNLTRLGARTRIAAGLRENTPEEIADWIRSPSSIKPGVLMPGVDQEGGGFPATGLSEEEVVAVAAYLSSLR